MIDVFYVFGQDRLEREFLHANVAAVDSGTLRRQVPDSGRLNAPRIDQTRHLDAATVRQVGDEAVVGDVAIDHARRTGLDTVNDPRAVL